jgi:hypothetical protein
VKENGISGEMIQNFGWENFDHSWENKIAPNRRIEKDFPRFD